MFEILFEKYKKHWKYNLEGCKDKGKLLLLLKWALCDSKKSSLSKNKKQVNYWVIKELELS